MSSELRNASIKRVPLTIGLLLTSGLAFTASLDFNAMSYNWIVNHVSGNSEHRFEMGLMCGGILIYLVIGIIVILAIWLIWIGIRDWPLNPN